MPGTFSAALAGDFDLDNDVDGADFLRWQRNFSNDMAKRTDGDSNDDGIVDGDDVASWQASFGLGPAPLTVVAESNSASVAVEVNTAVEVNATTSPQAASIQPSLVDAALASSPTKGELKAEEAFAEDSRTLPETYYDSALALEDVSSRAPSLDELEVYLDSSDQQEEAEDFTLTDEVLTEITLRWLEVYTDCPAS